MGARTSLLYRGDLFLRGFDGAVREHLQEELTKSGVDLQFNTDISSIVKQPDGSLLAVLQDGRELACDCVLYATGRRPMLDNLGLENTAVELDERGYVRVDEQYQSSEPSILAIGDMIGRVQLTPVALAEGMAVARRLFKPEQYRAVDYQLIPTAVFSLPNIATVGLSEEQAVEEGHSIKVFESRFRPMQLSFSASQQKTLMKLVVDADSDRMLGCHMVGPDAGEIIQGIAVAMKAGATKQHFDDTMGIHPTAAEEFVTMRTPLAR
jgi:glutathione reductase (NADPH)